MSQVNSLDSIIRKYQNRLQPDSNPYYQSPDQSQQSDDINSRRTQKHSRSLSKQSIDKFESIQNKQQSISTSPIRNNPTQTHIYTPQSYYPAFNYEKYSKLLYDRQNQKQNPLTNPQQQFNININKLNNGESYNPYILAKYKQTLNLYYTEVSKTKNQMQQIQALKVKVYEIQKSLRQMQGLRIADKMQYAQKLQMLNSNYNSTLNNPLQQQLLQKIQLLQTQTGNLKTNEQQLKSKIKLIQQQNKRLNEFKICEKVLDGEISFYQRNSQEQYNDASRSNYASANFNYNLQTDRLYNNEQFYNLKLNYEKLQSDFELLIQENAHLKQQNRELSDQIQEYKYKIVQIHQKYNNNNKYSKSPQKRFNQTMRKPNYKDNHMHTGSSISNTQSSTSSSCYSKINKSNNDMIVEKKLKDLQKEYEKLSSQMLTVQSAKRIAKQTSKYYFNKY